MTRTGRMLCLAGAALGVFALLGWALGLPLLTTGYPGQPPMMPITGISLTLLGVVGALWYAGEGQRTLRLLMLSAAVLVLIVGLDSIINYTLGFDLPLLVRPGPHGGRLSPLTGVAITLLASGLLLLHGHSTLASRLPDWLFFAAAASALTALLGHLFEVAPLYRLPHIPVIGVSLPTALALICVSVGLLLARPDGQATRALGSKGPGGILLRRLAMPAIIIPVLLGMVVTRVVESQLPLAVAILASSITVVGLLGLTMIAGPMNRAHEAIVESRARIKDFVEQASDGIFVADLDGRYTEVNSAGCEILGRSRDEIIGKAITDWLPAGEHERLAAAREELLQGGVQVAEWHLRHRDGHFIPVEVSAKILSDGRWQGFVRDITERKKAEEEARASRARIESIVSSAADAIISMDKDLRIVLFNEAAERTFGWSRDEALGQPWTCSCPRVCETLTKSRSSVLRMPPQKCLR